MAETPNSTHMSTGLLRIAALAKQSPTMAFTTLAHHLNLDWFKEAYRLTRKTGAPGIDGQTAEHYAKELEPNLQSLLDRAKSGKYQAPPVKRVHIPKGDGKSTRPLGLPTFEDKVLQRAVMQLLEPIWEQDFLNCSYGFRPGRSAHQALQQVWKTTMEYRRGWVLEVDIQGFFDNLDHGHLRQFVQKRVKDGVLLKLIDKWLKAGVMEAGVVEYPDAGTPQGGVISPLLANIYLHEVLDVWWTCEVKPLLKGKAELVRYADDATMMFANEEDARRVFEVLPKRFEKYGLKLNAEKTRLLEFRPPDGGGKGESFDLLGFTHYWGESRNGKQIVKRKTSKKGMSRALRAINQWCRANRHQDVSEQQRMLALKLRGHCGYFGIIGNSKSLAEFAREVKKSWKKWLGRRSQRAALSWERFQQLLDRYPLPVPRVVQHF